VVSFSIVVNEWIVTVKGKTTYCIQFWTVIVETYTFWAGAHPVSSFYLFIPVSKVITTINLEYATCI